jgi:hypothetical protein
MVELDYQTELLVGQLHAAWSTNAKSSCYMSFRDQILSRREEVDTCVTTLKAVVTVTCPEIAAKERYSDPRWEELFALAETIDSGDEEHQSSTSGKRKRTYNETNRIRNLAVVSALWSLRVVRQYGWNTVAQGQMKLLRACAIKYPHFSNQFCPQLNRVLLDRHCEAISFGRLKTLNEAPLQIHRDLHVLALNSVVPDPIIEDLWINSTDGAVPVDQSGRLLKDLRPHHVQQHLLCKDSFGLLVARGEYNESQVAVEQLSFTYDHYFDNNDIFAVGPDLTVSPANVFAPSSVQMLLDSFTANSQPDNPCPELEPAQTYTYRSSLNCNGLDLTNLPEGSVDGALNTFEDFILDNAFAPEVLEQHSADATTFNSTAARKRRRNNKGSDSNPQQWASPHPSTVHVLPAPRSDIASSNPQKRWEPDLGPVKPCLCVGTPVSHGNGRLVLEEELHNRYHQLLSSHIRKERDGVGEQRRMRSQWLSPETQWARIWSGPATSSLLPGSAASKTDSDVLYYLADDFVEAAQSGEVFQQPVVIKEAFTDAGMHDYQHFASLLDDASRSDEQVDVRCLDQTNPMLVPLNKLTSYLQSRPDLEKDLYASTARSVVKCHRPLFTMLKRFRLLESLSEGFNDSRPSTMLKAMSVSFNTITFPGAFSGAYLDTLAGSWQRNLHGIKFWTIVPADKIPPDELPTVMEAGHEWAPKGKQRLIVLEENDVLFIPPGLRLVQAWHSPMTCLTEQGMLWDDLSVLSIVESIGWSYKHGIAGDDRVAPQLPRVVTNLERLIAEQPDRFRASMHCDEFQRRFRKAIQAWTSNEFVR